jgi:hypothetical protein
LPVPMGGSDYRSPCNLQHTGSSGAWQKSGGVLSDSGQSCATWEIAPKRLPAKDFRASPPIRSADMPARRPAEWLRKKTTFAGATTTVFRKSAESPARLRTINVGSNSAGYSGYRVFSVSEDAGSRYGTSTRKFRWLGQTSARSRHACAALGCSW